MEQIRQIGEVLGSLKTLMIFHNEIKINQRQCILLFDSFNLAFNSITQQIKNHLKFDERHTKWKSLEHPLKELHRIFREGEQYIKNCIELRDYWGRAIALNRNTDCVEFYIHNLLWCLPVVFEAIETISEITGSEQEEINMRRIIISQKYCEEWINRTFFDHKFGKCYLVHQEMCQRFDSVFREDKWLLSETISEKRSKSPTKQENRLSELLLSPKDKIFPCSVLIGSPDYQVRRRLGTNGAKYKEIQWMGESFAMKHAIGEGEVEILVNEIAVYSSLAHPNVMNYICAFSDEDKRECFLVMELMSKDLLRYIKEVCSTRRKVTFPLLVAVDIMLQISRGMEYLHSKEIYHGDLNPSNILIKAKNSSHDSYLQVKVANFGLPLSKSPKNSEAKNPCIWYAPEVLLGQDHFKYTEKADVYSFAMICFELLTGKVPFEDSHLQGDKMSRNIRAGERPLFPFPSPKYLANLTKRCWHADPLQRPSFSSISRILRYIKRFLVLNPDIGQGETPNPSMDYFEIDALVSKNLSKCGRKKGFRVWEIPFEMYAYRVIERERTNANFVKENNLDSESEGASVCGDENSSHGNLSSEDSLSNSVSLMSNGGSEGSKKGSMSKKLDGKAQKQTGQHQKAKTARPSPQLATCTRSMSLNNGHLQPVVMSPGRRRKSTDSEL
ncbi:uncharacterized protein A4U43_C05F27280 [Asparagus officinalis]|uniref:Protein kinase domain-containing protein n=1 Tax=Asparagus officinalis TaxID=4686 RepID=A0A5P1F090_ASPOF|nr:probable serine/threonine-protein kinase roco7 [Asparagus officinalis]ONK69840.1 uncharacterized protein A4U43_C05F27280 [Asparagus officinalis]